MVNNDRYDEWALSSARPRVVLADDDPVVHSTVGSQLLHAFDCVGSARDAEEAISLVETHKPDVAILDVDMPKGGAVRATREIHTRAPDTAIVILSSDEHRQVVVQLISSGAVTYLRKGIDAHSLTATLFDAMRSHRELRDNVRRIAVPAEPHPAGEELL
jgi:DNA-binding NarL/FixJ family response regulator